MKSWLKDRIPSTDWNTEMFTAEDVVNFHNDFTLLYKTKLLNSKVNRAKERLQNSQRNLGLAFIGVVFSLILSVLIHFSICIIPCITFLVVFNSVTKNRAILNTIKNNF